MDKYGSNRPVKTDASEGKEDEYPKVSSSEWKDLETG